MAPRTKNLTFKFKMGFTELLTTALVVLKLTGHIAWPWLLVLSPMLIGFAIYLTLVVIAAIFGSR